jgi:hypothetical protein
LLSLNLGDAKYLLHLYRRRKKGRERQKVEVRRMLSHQTPVQKNIDYSQPENYAVDFFCSHKVSKKKNSGGFDLKARWKGFTEGEDTWEPITNQAEDNPALVKKYLMKISAEQAEPIKSALKDLYVFFPKEVVEMLLDS